MIVNKRADVMTPPSVLPVDVAVEPAAHAPASAEGETDGVCLEEDGPDGKTEDGTSVCSIYAAGAGSSWNPAASRDSLLSRPSSRAKTSRTSFHESTRG